MASQHSSPRDIVVDVAGEQIELLPEGAAYWRAQKTLLVSDLHWGKTATFRNHGFPISDGVLADDLKRLGQALTRTGASRWIVLGDLIHHRSGMTEEIVDRIAQWRVQHPQAAWLVQGNHDRWVKSLPDNWLIDSMSPVLEIPPFRFVHDPETSSSSLFTWGGHLHPTIKLQTGADRVRLPCFLFEERRAILPAFSRFVGGKQFSWTKSMRVYAVADSVIPLGHHLRSDSENLA